MATIRRVFTLRLPDEVFDQIGRLASKDRRSMTCLLYTSDAADDRIV